MFICKKKTVFSSQVVHKQVMKNIFGPRAVVCQLLVYTNDLLGKFIPPPTKGAKATNSLSGLSQIVLANVCELHDTLVLSHCSVCLRDFTTKCRWLSVLNKNGFKKVGAPLNPLWRSEVSWDSHPMSSSYYVHSCLPGRFLQAGPVLAPHVWMWLPAPVTWEAALSTDSQQEAGWACIASRWGGGKALLLHSCLLLLRGCCVILGQSGCTNSATYTEPNTNMPGEHSPVPLTSAQIV